MQAAVLFLQPVISDVYCRGLNLIRCIMAVFVAPSRTLNGGGRNSWLAAIVVGLLVVVLMLGLLSAHQARPKEELPLAFRLCSLARAN